MSVTIAGPPSSFRMIGIMAEGKIGARMSPVRAYRAGESLEDYCRACKTDRHAHRHGRRRRRGSRSASSAASAAASTTIAAARESTHRRLASCAACSARAARARCRRTTAREPFPIVSDRERIAPAMTSDASVDLELLLRRIIREECRHHPGRAGREMARRHAGAAPRHAGAAGEELADRNVLPQDRDAAQPAATLEQQVNAVRPARGCEGEAAGLRQRLLRIADQLQRAVRRRGRSVQGRWRRLRRAV